MKDYMFVIYEIATGNIVDEYETKTKCLETIFEDWNDYSIVTHAIGIEFF